MDRTRIHEGIRRMRFERLLDRQEGGALSQVEAAELLGISERSFRRWRDRLREEGPAGLADRRLGKCSLRRASVREISRMLDLYRGSYADFTVKHFHEQLLKRHGYKLGYTVTKVHLQRAGLVVRAPRRSAHRKKRARRPMVGMMLHQDASTHVWLPQTGRKHDLVVSLDDATSAILSAFLVDEEGTASSFRGLREVIERHGLFCALYTDRGSHYFYTPEADSADPGRPGPQAARHRAYPRLLARGSWPLRAGVPDASRPAAQGVGTRRHNHRRGRQSLDRADLHRPA